MLKLNISKINKIFVTVVFVLMQTVFLLLPSLIVNAVYNNQNFLIDGKMLAIYNSIKDRVELTWDFPINVGNGETQNIYPRYKIFKSLASQQDSLFLANSEKTIVIGNHYNWTIDLAVNEKYVFAACVLDSTSICSSYSNSVIVETMAIQSDLPLRVEFTNQTSEISGNKILYFSTNHPVNNFRINALNIFTNKKIALISNSSSSQAYSFALNHNNFVNGDYKLIAKVLLNSVEHNFEWPIKIITNPTNTTPMTIVPTATKTIPTSTSSKTTTSTTVTPTNTIPMTIVPAVTIATSTIPKTKTPTTITPTSKIGLDTYVKFASWPAVLAPSSKLFFNTSLDIDKLIVNKNGLASTEIRITKSSQGRFFINSNQLITSVAGIFVVNVIAYSDGIIVTENSQKIEILGDSLVNDRKQTKPEAIIKKTIEPETNSILIKEVDKTIELEIQTTENNKALTDETPSLKEKTLNQKCSELGIRSPETCNKYLKEKDLAPVCRKNNIFEKQKCDEFLSLNYFEKRCLLEGIKNKTKCDEFLSNKLINSVGCDNDQCVYLLEKAKNENLENIIIKALQIEELSSIKKGLLKNSFTKDEIESQMSEYKTTIPVRSTKILMRAIVAKSESRFDQRSSHLYQTPPIVLVFDNDGDGLSNDMEKRWGTDPNVADSDRDGFSDKNEIENGYNPLGEGKILKTMMAPIDIAILNNKELEHPKTSGEINKTFSITTIINKTQTVKENNNELEKKGYLISGVAKASSVVTLYIYSDLPLVITVTTDEFGNFEYYLENSLSDGEHEIYVAINDDSGKIISKSNLFSFFVKEAKAVSVKDFINIKNNNSSQLVSEEEKAINYFFYITIALILSSLTLFLVVTINKNKRQRLKQ